MKLADISGLDPDTLPYVVQSPLGTPVRVAFASLTPADGVPLVLPPWNAAIYAASWPAYIGNANARKLITPDGWRVLVARLVAESYAQGSGRVAVRPRPGSEAFYRRLGFLPIAPNLYSLFDAAAESLFEKATE